jgi:DNA-binding transcriptional regulator YiaG
MMDAKEIKTIRGSMSELDFALLLGVSPVTVWRWERGGIKPREGPATVLLELMRDHRRETLALLWKHLKPRMDGAKR